eukprot:comp20572_c0_seq1/m.26469 comp20572_c0_seq1/g.26469  ORF comp20572_c0_seq1/g.26469 comp20572_c0_seq1/m.26469 type:complete len:196 (-) comp20572_c0_seq1:593-1180(-)
MADQNSLVPGETWTDLGEHTQGLKRGIDTSDGDEVSERKTGGRRKIPIEFIDDKSRRHITFSKRKAGIMKKAYELSTLTGTQVLLLVASETGHVYTFATPKLQPLITKPEGKNLIQACLNAPDPPMHDTRYSDPAAMGYAGMEGQGVGAPGGMPGGMPPPGMQSYNAAFAGGYPGMPSMPGGMSTPTGQSYNTTT